MCQPRDSRSVGIRYLGNGPSLRWEARVLTGRRPVCARARSFLIFSFWPAQVLCCGRNSAVINVTAPRARAKRPCSAADAQGVDIATRGWRWCDADSFPVTFVDAARSELRSASHCLAYFAPRLLPLGWRDPSLLIIAVRDQFFFCICQECR